MTKRRILFYRKWIDNKGGKSGGQLKVRDAYEHFQFSDEFQPHIYFDPINVWDNNSGNVWNKYRSVGLDHWEINPTDVLFFSGTDWEILPEKMRSNCPVPIINIAHPRHTNVSDKRNQYLKYPAIRIIKSQTGYNILKSYGINGPAFVIPDAIDFKSLPEINNNPQIDILIVALKNQSLGIELYNKMTSIFNLRFKKYKIKLQIPPALPTRADFLNLLNNAKTTVFLPLTEERGFEGFYLPALEAMALKKFVICPNVIGNSDFCIPNVTCLQPEYNINSILKYIEKSTTMEDVDRWTIINNGYKKSLDHDIKFERESYLNILKNIDNLWQELKNESKYVG